MALWRAAGMPCAEYLKPMLAKVARDYAALGGAVEEDDLAQVLRMSASTIGRVVRGAGAAHNPASRNKRSGKNALRASIPEMPGSHLPEDKPGTCQVDSVALCGGNMAESFFHIATLTDAATQWFECAPSWNRGEASTTRAMGSIRARLPFDMLHCHPDNGTEFINHLFVNAIAGFEPRVQLSRSRPYRKNDNCRIEQKNGSVIRQWFSDIRFDEHSQLGELEQICRDIALYTNLFVPCKKLMFKQLKPGKGVKYRNRYDKPATPLERLRRFSPDDPRVSECVCLREQTNSIRLYKSIHQRLRQLVRGLLATTRCPRI
jgi:hypothetical protein